MVITILSIMVAVMYVIIGILIYFISKLVGVKYNNIKNVLLLIFYPIGGWFIK